MIFTRYGKPVRKVVWFNLETAECGIVMEDEIESEGDHVLVYHATELKAEGGIEEIIATAETMRGGGK